MLKTVLALAALCAQSTALEQQAAVIESETFFTLSTT
jgi:hypothetical protein